MANATLEREIARIQAKRFRERAVRDEFVADEQRERNDKTEYYRNLLRGESGIASRTPDAFEPVQTVAAPPAPVPSAAERIADYESAPQPIVRRRALFEGIEYKNGSLIDTRPVVEPAQAPVEAPTASEEDALPTRRTMDTLRRSESRSAAQEEQIGLFAALTPRAKLVFATVICAIVLALVVICVNTSVLNSLGAEVSALESVAVGLRSEAERLGEEIFNATSRESVLAFAQKMGWVLPG
ncbi:MAG: hypothetical protein ACI4NG_01980 [Candidatus Gallimonas sp.]